MVERRRTDQVDYIDKLPQQYKYLAYKAYSEKLISFERLSELLGRNHYELREGFYNTR